MFLVDFRLPFSSKFSHSVLAKSWGSSKHGGSLDSWLGYEVTTNVYYICAVPELAPLARY